MAKKKQLINREISWLSFNERVLQEAMDKSVPIIERLRFLGIFSNNRDEFYRVRVATIKRLQILNKKSLQEIDFNPSELLEEIKQITLKEEKLFENAFSEIINELKEHNIFIVNESTILTQHQEFIVEYFDEKIRPYLVPIILKQKAKMPSLKDKSLYLGVKLFNNELKEIPLYSLIEIPTNISRFLVLPSVDEKSKHVILIDDIIRFNLRKIYALFAFDNIEAYAFKITRDAELDLDYDISTGLLEKMEKSLVKRKKGKQVRFVYDSNMPIDLFTYLAGNSKQTDNENLIPGGKYHNFKDFIGFPTIERKDLVNKKIPSLEHPVLLRKPNILSCIKEEDVLLSYPYQSFSYIIEFLREAAIDIKVTDIQINLYRVAKSSRVINALVNAAKNGKNVTVIIELKARFDEENNIHWSNILQDNGIRVIFGVPGLKVHSKLILVTRKIDKQTELYAHIGTGNFHEGNAKIYGDYSLLTYDTRITNEVEKLFQFFEKNYLSLTFRHLIVSPYSTRRKFLQLIENEIKNVKAKKEAKITLKLNNLVDTALINKLYEASNAGVEINLIIRGICSLVPGVKKQSENIRVISIIDRFLEHARTMIFYNGGEELYFISSADWMTRNLDNRVEVTTPIYNKRIQKVINKMLELQLSDNVKARIINENQENKYVPLHGEAIRSQIETYKFFKRNLEKKKK
jgi:polyphosphate kinase